MNHSGKEKNDAMHMNSGKKSFSPLKEPENELTRGEEKKSLQKEKEATAKNGIPADSQNNLDSQLAEEVYPVYILKRVIYETVHMCHKAMPKEAIGILLGYKLIYKGKKYVKIVDWVTAEAEQSQTHARFTPKGVQQYNLLIDEKYGGSEERPRIVGIIHSHPFGSEPHFSATDYHTFLNVPYDAEHNVFILVDPKSGYYKSFIVVSNDNGQKSLEEVDWVEYEPR
jgi:proteasome lid subunit RPN8/RPN11